MRVRARQSGAVALALSTACALAIAGAPGEAEACGCLSPPDPQVLGEDDFAVNQQSEQIIFEVGEETVTAHVLIRYAGEPSQFAWIVPVPTAPEIELSPAIAFSLLDEATRPIVTLESRDLCPVPEYACEFHSFPECPSDHGDDGAVGLTGAGGTGGGDGEDGNAGDDAGGDDGGSPSGVDVIDMKQVGDYETVTFSATEADLAVQWLQDNGFIVNDTMTPYMMPYVEAGMVFVAAKLVPGAGIDSIAPLRLTYADTAPMIPLMLTAVAAEPHLTVTAYIYGDSGYKPSVRPIAVIDPSRIARDPTGRFNYPQVLARTVDDIGGDGWVVEYGGGGVEASFVDDSGCCDAGSDVCGIGGDLQCQCPDATFDGDDCGQVSGLLESIQLLERLAHEYPRMTRLSTRVSPEEMTYDPTFEPDPTAPLMDRLRLAGTESSLEGCEAQIIDDEAYALVRERALCSAVYCGTGECVVTDQGPGCLCDAGSVARRFTDLDGLGSVTCVPEMPPVDLAANTELPDACQGVDCGLGTCLDLGGVAACQCDGGAAGVAFAQSGTLSCHAVGQSTQSAGADDYSAALEEISVCAPPPPSCGQWGWLVPRDDAAGIHGEMCESSVPPAEALQIPPKPTCADLGLSDEESGCSCSASGGGTTAAMLWGFAIIAGWRLRRRRPRA